MSFLWQFLRDGREMKGHLRDLLTLVMSPYTGFSFNFLDYLGCCSDTVLFGCIAATRILLLCFMWFSRTIAPVLFRAPDRSFVFDTGEQLYDDGRFSMLRNWDGVHMFFIAHHGYLSEMQMVFFPGLPALIRGVQFVTCRLFPVFHRIAPVALYVSLMNIVACGLAGVALRRLMMLTLLGPEAVGCTCRWRDTVSRRSSGTTGAADSHEHAVTEDVVVYRLLCAMTGTALDAPDVHQSPPATVAAAESQARHRRRVVGSVALMWTLTPAMVFLVAVYTESLFALLTILGIYLLAQHEPLPWVVQQRIAAVIAAARERGKNDSTVAPPPLATVCASSLAQQWATSQVMCSSNREGDAAISIDGRLVPSVAALVRAMVPQSHERIILQWTQSFSSRAEVAAVALFTAAATLRSNAFIYAGFLIFPSFVQLVLPILYAAQGTTTLAGVSARRVLYAAAARCPAPSSLTQSGHTTLVVRCPTLCPPSQRWPHPLRLLVVLVECAVVSAPYLLVNAIGYYRFVMHQWNAARRATIGTAFWKLYPALQEKYWGVGFLSAYTFNNIPNVILALPVALLVGWCTYANYLAPAWASMKGVDRRHWRAWQRACHHAIPFVRSSNVVILVASLMLALSVMHVQVTNRFVMADPALYGLLGATLAKRPTSIISQVILLWSILWSIAGGILFSNHLPWT